MGIFLNFDTRWSTISNNAFIGNVFVEDKITNPANVFSLDYTINEDTLVERLKSLNGFWGAVVTDGETKAWLVSDRIRTFPIFYAQKEGNLFISSNAYWIREQCKFANIDPLAEKEFLMTGYVTGPDTLFKDIKQMQQGELIKIEWSEEEDRYIFTSYRYYRYLHKEPFKKTHQELLRDLDDAMCSAFKRLITIANGRTIVIPLSGGYDSRLVALMLKRLGYQNLMAYTYGAQDNQEATISKEVAMQLGIPWHFVEYTNEKWYEAYHSKEYREYESFAGGLASLPNCQDWLAVKELKERGTLSDDSIFAPGYSADLLAGSRSCHCYDAYAQNATSSSAFNAAIKFHYKTNLNPLRPDLILNRINNCIGNTTQYISPASLFESFDVAERQTKYINNAVRVYDYFGYKFWTPFWDISLFKIFEALPSNERMFQKLYLDYIIQESKMQNLFSGKELIRDATPPSSNAKCIALLKLVMPYNVFYTLKSYIKRRSLIKYFFSSSMGWYGCWNENEINSHLNSGFDNIIGMLSSDYINSIK